MSRGFTIPLILAALGLPEVEPFQVCVTSIARGDPAVVETIEEGRHEVEKLLRKKKSSFALTRNRDEAEIVIELQAYWTHEELESRVETRVNPPGQGVSRVEVLQVEEHHYLLALVTLLGAQKEMTGVQVKKNSGSVKGAARNLVEQIERYLKENHPGRFR